MAETMTFTGKLTVTSCWCGIHVAIPEDLYRMARQGKKYAYCPIGHQFAWKADNADKLRAELDQARADASFQRRQAERSREDAEAAQKRTAAAVAEVARTRRRVNAGVCPCCNRSFAQLARHVQNQHPDYLAADSLPADIARWNRIDAVTKVVEVAGEPLGPSAVLGRLVLAGRRGDTEPGVRAALYAAERTRSTVVRVAPSMWGPV